MTKILIIEDDAAISSGLQLAIENEGYEAICADDGDTGLYCARTEAPDLIILDIMMPYLNGFEVVTELRRQGNQVPILILSAREEVRDKVRGLDLGANDYMTKPFDLDELLARIRRLLKQENKKTSRFSDFEYAWSQQELRFLPQKKIIGLTMKERKLLEFFLKRSHQIVTREQIPDAGWGPDHEGTDRTVDNIILALRKKLGGKCILTERGSGYRFMTEQ